MNPTPRLPRLALNRLEEREMPAITAVLTSGTLRVTGTTGNDTVLIRQTAANTVTVAWTNVSKTFTGVRDIYADGQAGNDYLYFDTTTLKTNESKQALKAILVGGAGNDTIVAGAAGDSIYGGDGNDSLFSNSGNDIIIGGAGNDTISAGMGDDQIYGEAGDDYIFGSAGNDRLYGGEGKDYIDAGSGADLLQGGTGFDTFKNDFAQADLLDTSDPEDVRQGLSGTCVVLASLQAISGTGVDLSARIHKLSTNYYSVPIFRPGSGWINQTVFFDGSWTDNDPVPTPDGAAWTLLYQRAFLQEMHVNWMDPNAAGWAARYGSQFQNVDAAFIAITGKAQYIGSRPGGLLASDLTALRNAYNGNKPVIALSRPVGSMYSADLTRLGIITSHAYSVIGFGVKNGQTTVKLRNPWATDGPVKYGADDGIIEITWTDFSRVMLGFCISQ